MYSIKYIYMISNYILIQVFAYYCWNNAKRKEFLRDIEIYFYLIKINLYSIKYIYMISNYILIQSRQNCIYYIFYSIKICFYYMNFSFDTFLVTISGLPFYLQKSEFYFQYVNWTAARWWKKAAKKSTEY